MRTTKTVESDETRTVCTILAQNPGRSPDQRVRFPVTIRHRSARARIYAPQKNFPYYRLAYQSAGRRRMRTFGTYSKARAAGERLLKQLAAGSQAPLLTATQSRDAIAALDRLAEFARKTDRHVSLLQAVSEFVGAAGKLHDHSLTETVAEVVETHLRTAAVVKRMDLGEAVTEFIAGREHLTKLGANGERGQLSAKYAYNLEIQLRRFADSLVNSGVCDLSKQHLDTFFKALSDLSPKSRNHHRAAVRMFLDWCVRKDYLPKTHRLGEADQMRPERSNMAAVEFYTPAELQALLEAAAGEMRAMVAIGGLAGLRTAELLRLTWQDVWRVPGHIEVTAGKSKTRQRRLVEVCPALARWLEEFRGSTEGLVCTLHEITWQQHFVKLCDTAQFETKPGVKVTVTRKPNGLRHAFCTYHFALHADENSTAMQAGNSPAMIHAHYKGLATKRDAKRWFDVSPLKPANVLAMPKPGAVRADAK